MTFKLKTALTTLIIIVTYNLNAQNKEESEVFNTLKKADSLLFDVGFNKCYLPQVEQLVADDIEFYHDRDGITKSKEKFIASIKDNLCNSGKNIIKRELDKSSFKVFPLYRDGKIYGAIQNGSHSFGQTQAEYSHLWLIQKNEWKLSRVLSYNHHTVQGLTKASFLEIPTEDLEKYVGNYEFSPDFVLTISIKEGDLFGGSQGQDVKINCYDKHKFIDDEKIHDLEFILDEKGNISSLRMKGSGMEMTAQKTK